MPEAVLGLVLTCAFIAVGMAVRGYVAGMIAYVAPGSLKDHPFTLKAAAPGDYNVRINGLLAGRIMLKPVSGGREVWFWTITGPYIPVDMLPSNGEADTLAEAKEEFRTKFNRWREWAVMLNHDVIWNGKA